MKRDMDDLNLRDAFAPMPEGCRRALMDAANSVKEEQPMKRLSFRAVLIAALIIAATMAVAIAATQLGWEHFFTGYDRLIMPQTAKDALNATRPQTCQVGPMTFTANQLLADGRIALCSTEVRTTDGSDAVYAADCNDLTDPVDAGSLTSLARYGLSPGITWLEAARALNCPLYRVRAIVEVDAANDAGVAMEDAIWNEDGSIVYFSMPYTLPETTLDSLKATLYMRVSLCDPETGEEIDRWTSRQEMVIPVAPLLAEKTYTPSGDAELNGMLLGSVHAEQFATGVYLTSSFTLPDDMSEDAAAEALYGISLCDENGDRLPMGISLSGEAITDDLPAAKYVAMTSLETLPDIIVVTDGQSKVIVK